MTRRIRVQGKYRRPLDEDQLALALLMLARQLREERAGAEGKPARAKGKRRAA